MRRIYCATDISPGVARARLLRQLPGMNIFQHNLELLTQRHPELGRYLAAIAAKEKVASVRTDDGAHCYVRALPEGKWQPLTPIEEPLRKSQLALDAMEARLERGLAPAVIAGLNAGLELDAIFTSFRQIFHQKQIPRRIIVITESPLVLLAWLHHIDRSDILNCPLVEWYRPGVDLDALIRRMEEDDCLSHNFAPVSSLPQPQIENLIAPLTRLFLQRQKQELLWRTENEAYYHSLNDTELSLILAGEGKRRPRALLFAHASSTVVQFSMRDTRWALEQAGWDVDLVLMSEELPPWLVHKRLHSFRPDLALMANHLRSEDPVGFWPENLLFVTWIQDTCPDIMQAEASRKWREQSAGRQRDLIIGYIDQIRPFGYPPERLRSCGMITSPASLDPGPGPFDIEADVCFASNCSKTSAQLIREDLLPKLSSKGIDLEMLNQFDAVLWASYRAGDTCISSEELSELIHLKSPRLARALKRQTESERRYCLDRLFWEHNNLVYRHVVLEWLEDAGYTLALYGRGWEQHPRFGRWAKGVAAHGPELGRAFRKSRFALHLNPNEGSHQRLSEIIAAGATPLIRRRPAMHLSRVYARLMHAAAQGEQACVSHLPRLAKILDLAPHFLSAALNDHLDLVLWGESSPVFNTADELAERLKNPPQPLALSQTLLAFSAEQLIRQLGGRQLKAGHWLSLLSGLAAQDALPASVQTVIGFDAFLQAQPIPADTPAEEPCASLIRLLQGAEVSLPLKTSVDSDRLANLLYNSCLAGAAADKPELIILRRRLVYAWPQNWQETRLFLMLIQQLDSLIAEAAT